MKDDFSSRMKKVTRSLGDVESRTRRATSGFKNLTTSMAGMAGAIGLTSLLNRGMGLLKSSVGKAFDRIDTMERYQSTMTLLLGTADAAKDSLGAINEIVTGTAFGLDLAAKSVQAFVSRGIELSKATGWFETLGDAVTFYGDGSNEQLESVMEAMGKMVSAGKISMMQMNTLFAAGIDAPGIYAQAVGKDVKAVRKALSKGKIPVEDFFDTVVHAMNEGTNGVQKIAGAAKESGATWANVIANMKTAIVRGVMTIIMTIDEMLEKNGLPAMRVMISAFGKAAEKAIKKVAEAIGPVIGAFVKMHEAMKPIIPLFKSLAQAIGIALLAVGGFFAIIGTLKLVALAFMAVTWPVWLAIGAIAGLVLVFKSAYKHSEPFRKAMDGIANAFKAVFSVLTGSNEGSMKARMGMLTAGMDNEKIRKVFTFAHKLKEGFETIKGAFKILTGDSQGGSDILRNAGLDLEQINKIHDFAEGFKDAFDRIKLVYDGIGTLILGGGSEDLLASLGISQKAFDLFKATLPLIKEALIAAVVAIGAFKLAVVGLTIVKTVVTFIKAWRLATVGMTTAQIALNLAMSLNPIGLLALGIAGLVTAGVMLWRNWESVTAATKNFWESIGGLEGAISIILGPLGFLINAAIDLAKNWDSTKSVWENVWGAIQRSAATSINAVIGLINNMIDVINNIPFVKIDAVAQVDWGAATPQSGDFRRLESESMSKGKSNYHGIDYVPRDGYQATLHKGESVITAQENREGSSGSFSIAKLADQIIIREDADIDRITDQLYRKWSAAAQGGA